jgi:glycosyltransferase involved in cell wall biosynthesis
MGEASVDCRLWTVDYLLSNNFKQTTMKYNFLNSAKPKNHLAKPSKIYRSDTNHSASEILLITSYPPRECGIATYSQDLVKALNKVFKQSFNLSICAIAAENEAYSYPSEVKYVLQPHQPNAFVQLAQAINDNPAIEMIMIQHEFGFFAKNELEFKQFLAALRPPIVLVFHTVLPQPSNALKILVKELADFAQTVMVMTHLSAQILTNDYEVSAPKIVIIPHGTHLVPHSDKEILKNKYNLSGKKILATFGLLSSGKSIETTLAALPAIIKQNPEVLFLIIGKTHPSVLKQEGEMYREMLEAKVITLKLQQHVQFINHFLPLPTLLEYLQLTDIYLFTSKDRFQAVSGTFAYASSCGCPIVSTPIPHAREVLQNDAGIIFDFENSVQLAQIVIDLLDNETLRKNISSNALHRMAATAWENVAIAHAQLFREINPNLPALRYQIPPINLDYIQKMTTDFGIIQFAKINQPDIESGYTLDDNARALVAMCQQYELTMDESLIKYIKIYFNFIKYCLQPEGYFLNYVNQQKNFTEQNNATNLADANGRAIWALGYLQGISHLLPPDLHLETELTIRRALPNIQNIYSTRAMAFAIKGLYYYNRQQESTAIQSLIGKLADRLVQMYKHEADQDWLWYESYLTYANSILPEAMLCAWLATQKPIYKEIAKSSFDFLLAKIFNQPNIKVISNRGWLLKHQESVDTILGGEQPIDVAYTILALSKFYEVLGDKEYAHKLETSFNWFLGDNHLHQIIYNPCTGGCYDGLEENYVNLNQGAESTVSYLMARLTIETFMRAEAQVSPLKQVYLPQINKNKLANL